MFPPTTFSSFAFPALFFSLVLQLCAADGAIPIVAIEEMGELKCGPTLKRLASASIEDNHGQGLVTHAAIGYPAQLEAILAQVDSPADGAKAVAQFLAGMEEYTSKLPPILATAISHYKDLKQENLLGFCAIPDIASDGEPIGTPHGWFRSIAKDYELHGGKPIDGTFEKVADADTHAIAGAPKHWAFFKGMDDRTHVGLATLMQMSNILKSLRSIADMHDINEWAKINAEAKKLGRDLDPVFAKYNEILPDGTPSLHAGFLLTYLGGRSWNAATTVLRVMAKGIDFQKVLDQNLPKAIASIESSGQFVTEFLRTHKIDEENLFLITENWARQIQATLNPETPSP